MAAGGTAGAAAGALPAFFEFDAMREWRAIDFISDLHLGAALPRTFDAFAAHLRGTSADAVIILGDLFEAWVGDDARELPFESRCVDAIAAAAAHRSVAFMVGNRDFLVGAAMLHATGMTALPDPTVLRAWGQRVLLTHGDALCVDDVAYQRFRAVVRSAEWQSDFLARPLAERIAVAADMRRQSAGRQQAGKPHDDGDAVDIDVDAATAVAWMHAMGAAEMVHGHTHRPGSDALAPGFKRHVLSDWDLDAGDRAEVLRLTRDGFERRRPESR